MKSALAVVTSLALSACATTPVPTGQERLTSAVLSVEMTTSAPTTGQLNIKRDVGHTGSFCAVRVTVDGKPLAELRTGEYVVAHLPAGEYVLGAQSTGICGGGDSEFPVVVKSNEKRAYRVSIDQGGSVRIGPTAF